MRRFVLASIGLVLESLISCVRLRLNSKQKILICRVSFNEGGVSKLIEDLAVELDCSAGCLWGNLRELKEIGLVSGGGLTELGEIVCLELRVSSKMIRSKSINGFNFLKGGDENGR